MDKLRYQSLLETYRNGLLNDTIPFWTKHAPDPTYGGFLTALDRDGSVMDTDKSVWHQGRFTWLLGELYNNVEPREEWLELACSGASFMEQHCFDPTDGRLTGDLTRRPFRNRKRVERTLLHALL